MIDVGIAVVLVVERVERLAVDVLIAAALEVVGGVGVIPLQERARSPIV
jgi:hypothetical protein